MGLKSQMVLKFSFFGYQGREKIIGKINKTIEVHRQNGASIEGNGVLGRLLEEESLPDDAVADFIINLLFAGNETTTKTMLFAVYFLTQCPRAMKQLLVYITTILDIFSLYVYLVHKTLSFGDFPDFYI